MPRPAKIDGTDKCTKLLDALVHWVMHNNLLTLLNLYMRIDAHKVDNVLLNVCRSKFAR